MDTIQILKNIKRDSISQKNFKGVFPRDFLPKKFKLPTSFIANTENSKSEGQHWLAFFIDNNGKLDFFDPMGFPPEFYKLDDYCNSISTSVEFNKIQFQSFFSNYCGFYCLLFIFVKSRNKLFNSKVFTYNYKKNDLIVKKLIKENFFVF